MQMLKDVDTQPPDTSIVDAANLFLCTNGPNCWSAANPSVNNGHGHLVVLERLFNQFDADGAGAFEFQLKFDHKVFDITVFHGVDLNGDGDCADTALGEPGACYLYETGRVPGAVGVGGCAVTLVTENWILFGCVSKDPDEQEPIQPGPVGASAVIATIHIDPEPDLVARLTPGQKNGIVRPILDENCEVADVYGDPLGTGQYDALGREIPLPGVVTGGLIEDCGDVTITVRMLEGDVDLDCDVDVNDQQALSFRYGAAFGVLLYDPFFDLEPPTKDFDIDVKDVQKVFGRDGSTCDAPIPPQDPQPPPPSGPVP
ncbi:MAG TPA: hypothetical protein VNM43_03755 [Dehalococcoidia bacterium]|nr:hypothetical protein [Dehalococcoidia bacterium]